MKPRFLSTNTEATERATRCGLRQTFTCQGTFDGEVTLSGCEWFRSPFTFILPVRPTGNQWIIAKLVAQNSLDPNDLGTNDRRDLENSLNC